MSFKIHDKLNRITRVAATLQESGKRIEELSKKLSETQKDLDLLTVYYMQVEMEYGELIGEDIEHLAAIEVLLKKYDMDKKPLGGKPNKQNFYVIRRFDGKYWGGPHCGWTRDKSNSIGFPDEKMANEFTDINFKDRDPNYQCRYCAEPYFVNPTYDPVIKKSLDK